MRLDAYDAPSATVRRLARETARRPVVSRAVLHTAALTVCGQALDAADAVELLDALGLLDALRDPTGPGTLLGWTGGKRRAPAPQSRSVRFHRPGA